MSMTHRLVVQFDRAIAALEAAQPAAQWLARLYVAKVFLLSGLTKVRDWDITLALFADEYQVPLLSPTIAAWLGTGAELLLPVLLALGITGRAAALGLFMVNAVAVISLSEIGEAALQQHVFWGSLLLGLMLWGPGRWSFDAWWVGRLARRLHG
jgi:putative oxidoreductase